MSDIRVIAGNTAEATATYRAGARAYVLQFAGDRTRLLIRSRSGRWVRKWVAAKDVRNLRTKIIADSDPLRGKLFHWSDEVIAEYLGR